MPFEKTLRHLIRQLPERDVPSGLQARVLAHIKQPDTIQKAYFPMKPIMIPIAALVMVGSGLFFTGYLVGPVHVRMIAPLPAQRTTVRLHLVDVAGKPVSDAAVTLWGYDAPDPTTGVAPPLRIDSPLRLQARSNRQGDVMVPENRLTQFSATADGLRLNAMGEITANGGEQVVTLLEHPPHSVTGRFVDAQGRPLKGVKLELYVADSQTTQGLMTDQAGYFIAWIVPGNDYAISLIQPGYAPYRQDRLRVEAGKSVNLGTITLPPSR